MKILFSSILTGLLFISVSAFAADSDYSQTQNKIDDKQNAPKPTQANPSDKKDDTKYQQSNDKRDAEMKERKDRSEQHRDPAQSK